MEALKYDEYPVGIIFLSNLLTVLTYATGAFIMSRLGVLLLILYLLYLLFIETKLLKHCASCYYYGKACAFGRGKLSCLFFKRDDPLKFTRRQLAWKDLLPDFLVSIIPAVTGIFLLVRHFDWLILSLLAALFVLSSAGNAFVRGNLACKHCKQRESGCPALKLIDKKSSI